MRILFFLESLHAGGKERRSVELMRYLINQPERYEINLVLTEDQIHYEEVRDIGVDITVLKRKGLKYDPSLFLRFMKVCRSFRPDLIHAWGKMATFYAIPSKVIFGIPLVSSLIADSSRSYGSFSGYAALLRTNLLFSDIILSNSYAGLESYRIRSPKSRVIYNGVRLSRFNSSSAADQTRKELGVTTKYMVVMVASFSSFKDYDLFVDVASGMLNKRKDLSFVAVGDGPDFGRITERIKSGKISNIILAGRRRDVENIVAAADIGLLCTKKEGISNSIIEYMALGKPVIATDTEGGSRELIIDGETGYCTGRDRYEVIRLIEKLLNDKELASRMGARGKERIEQYFSIEKMGAEFNDLYRKLTSPDRIKQSVIAEESIK
ncbi:MAG TPA: glycosyltransferase family 4 protein [Bacteroidales bacterium]|jgi:glycosyltransferase involved in cell wall biosynthesis|nr:glycosyltransferase family 4 protein [Bacteroidales bacterium]